jgi:hypothetical protein
MIKVFVFILITLLLVQAANRGRQEEATAKQHLMIKRLKWSREAFWESLNAKDYDKAERLLKGSKSLAK